jgi:hypothetical protein
VCGNGVEEGPVGIDLETDDGPQSSS